MIVVYMYLSSPNAELAEKVFCSSYDCEFASLAKELNIPLVTTDKEIIKAFPRVAVSAKDYIRKEEFNLRFNVR